MSAWRCSALLSLVIVFAVGCANENPLNRQRVSGTVALAGEPVAAGTIEFVSETFMSGATIQEGKFQIDEEKGIPPGEYLIRISVPDLNAPRQSSPDAPGEVKAAKELVPEEFNQKSKETRTIAAGQANVFSFEIPKAEK